MRHVPVSVSSLRRPFVHRKHTIRTTAVLQSVDKKTSRLYPYSKITKILASSTNKLPQTSSNIGREIMGDITFSPASSIPLGFGLWLYWAVSGDIADPVVLE